MSARSRADARDALRAALTCAVEEEIITRDPAAIVRLPAPRTRKRRCWSVDEARQFLESTRHDQEALYAAFVLILVLGLRKGEVLGLTWELVDLDAAELYVGETQNGRSLQKEPASDLGGRYWDRTSDLLGVNRTLAVARRRWV
jgi:integrase